MAASLPPTVGLTGYLAFANWLVLGWTGLIKEKTVSDIITYGLVKSRIRACYLTVWNR
ncbi:hypothetical protein GCM10027295_36550 [Pseudaeromonas pectinilytica]